MSCSLCRYEVERVGGWYSNTHTHTVIVIFTASIKVMAREYCFQQIDQTMNMIIRLGGTE